MVLSKQDKVAVKLAGELEVTAYIRVQHVAGTKHSVAATVAFLQGNGAGELYKSNSYSFTPNMDSANFIAQAYEHLKTLPEFAGATDC